MYPCLRLVNVFPSFCRHYILPLLCFFLLPVVLQAQIGPALSFGTQTGKRSGDRYPAHLPLPARLEGMLKYTKRITSGPQTVSGSSSGRPV